ncbi:SigB/SigF/SigG family RNA polymerase sigma factor [Streptomyces sp. NPDC004838]
MVRSHAHDDAPDTTEGFLRLATMPVGPDRDRLRGDLVEAWLPMAHRIAGKYRNRGESLEDLQQVAAVGLVKAVNRYDPFRGTPFPSYAVPTITGEVRRHFRDCLWALSVPRRVQELRGLVRPVYQELSRPGHTPSATEVAERAGVSREEAAAGLAALHAFTALSYDTGRPASGGDEYLLDAIGAPDPAIDRIVDREAAKPGLRNLPEREREILYLRFFVGMTQHRIGEELGISQMHVSRLIHRSCARVHDEALPDAN